MLERKWGRIINTGSMHALVASPYKSAYNAAKHGIAGESTLQRMHACMVLTLSHRCMKSGASLRRWGRTICWVMQSP